MGNSLGGKRSSKVMKINGETFKLKTPVTAEEVVKDYPGHVLLESEAVKRYGIGAKPLFPFQKLEPNRLYFLVELPEERVPRRVRSGLNMSAKDRLESLRLSRRSVSDLSLLKHKSEGSKSGAVRVKMRIPKAEVERLMKESENEADAAHKIMQLCMVKRQQLHWKGDHGSAVAQGFKGRRRRVSFVPINGGSCQIPIRKSSRSSQDVTFVPLVTMSSSPISAPSHQFPPVSSSSSENGLVRAAVQSGNGTSLASSTLPDSVDTEVVIREPQTSSSPILQSSPVSQRSPVNPPVNTRAMVTRSKVLPVEMDAC
ncbi:hypothetical protein J1N35_026554 [Gossypium stocksii]|uniref:Uncharacterized protein n=1 Tax=Gossypium stocksii TaxID=47602 RepID=A0A9D3V9Z4_9ROSI|nr:hypothetical protein J1N35_026554 [Gossypium stocksii]